MKKIILAGIDLSDSQTDRLAAIGEVSRAQYSSQEEWLKAVKDADVIFSDGDYLLENLEKLNNVFITYPYIELGSFDSEKLAEKGVYVANTKGSNRNSIIEWSSFVILSLFRKFPDYLNTEQNRDFRLDESLEDKNVLIIGKGSIGTGIGDLCLAFKMNVEYFVRGDDLKSKAADADLVVNSLNCNSTSQNLLDKEFFMNLKKGSYYLSFVRQFTYDLDGMFKSLDANILGGAAIDCDPEDPFSVENDFYQKCLSHEKVLVTPHVAFATKTAAKNGKETAIKNIEAYCSGSPQNLIKKK